MKALTETGPAVSKAAGKGEVCITSMNGSLAGRPCDEAACRQA
ncbi:hypothetical protein BH09PSE5_BH09PSE5_30130 [soil metagenome]